MKLLWPNAGAVALKERISNEFATDYVTPIALSVHVPLPQPHPKPEERNEMPKCKLATDARDQAAKSGCVVDHPKKVAVAQSVALKEQH